jgi:hypothetical protein
MSIEHNFYLPEELIAKIEQSRGSLNAAELVELGVNIVIATKASGDRLENQYITQHDLTEFKRDIKALLTKAIEFLVSYQINLS